ncbi:MAG: sulfotransferase family 2 domain-containing protein [Thermoanaerobaculia bacterium]|nr:sulfotransferase family 2 domain-containing protein [Thermoanaerobaculia bacterium]
MINHRHRFICIDIPRVASRSLYLSLQPGTTYLADDLGIPYLEEVRGKAKARIARLEPEVWREYYKFAFVRNPWSRAVSMWWFLETGAVRTRLPAAVASLPFVLRSDRRRFLRFLKKIPGYLSDDREDYFHERWHVAPQHEHLIDPQGELALDFVGRFEHLQRDFDFVCRQVGLDARRLEHVHKSRCRLYTDYYDEEAKDLVAQIYARDVETFGYAFPETDHAASREVD